MASIPGYTIVSRNTFQYNYYTKYFRQQVDRLYNLKQSRALTKIYLILI